MSRSEKDPQQMSTFEKAGKVSSILLRSALLIGVLGVVLVILGLFVYSMWS